MTVMPCRLGLCVCLAIAMSQVSFLPVAAQTAGLEDGDPGARYRACMDLARSDPDRGLDSARAWETEGGGNAARHCAAIALDGQGDHVGAAVGLEEIGREAAPRNPALAAGLLEQAGQSWLLAENPDRATAVLAEAATLAAGNAALYELLAYAHAGTGDYRGAVDALDRALDLGADGAGIYLLRAAAHRALGDYVQALGDADRAVARESDNPDIFLERGNIRRLDGDRDGARRDWRQAIALAPDSAAAETARINLERLGDN